MAEALMKYETIDAEQIEDIMNGLLRVSRKAGRAVMIITARLLRPLRSRSLRTNQSVVLPQKSKVSPCLLFQPSTGCPVAAGFFDFAARVMGILNVTLIPSLMAVASLSVMQPCVTLRQWRCWCNLD